jgi:hypothetical protein
MLKYAHGRIGRRAVALRLGLLFGAQVYLSTEIFATLTVSLVTSLVVAFIVVAEARTRLRSAVPALLGAYVIGCVVAAPLLWYALTDFRTGSIVDPSLFPADLLNVVVPTEATFLSGDRASALSQDFRGNLAENGAYLGLPLLAVLGWFTWARRREPGARLLVVLIALGVVAELGLALHVGGDRIIALPWALAAKLPALGIVLPVRFTMYVALGVAVAAALWAASPRPSWWVRTALVAAAAISLLPAVSRDLWSTTPARVAFFTDELYRTCLRPNESVLIPSAAFMDATLWQVESDFRFRLASGYLGSDFPEGVPHEDVAFDVLYSNVPEGGGAAVLRLARGLGATTILVDAEHVDLWRPVLAEAGLEPVANGGVWLYHLGPVPPACRG